MRSAGQPNVFKEAGITYVRVPNIMPTIHELNVKPAREAIHEQFIHQITRASGLAEFSRYPGGLYCGSHTGRGSGDG